MTRALVVGYGSVGRRHARVLKEMGIPVGIVSRHVTENGAYRDIPSALSASGADHIVIANETADHYCSLVALAEANYGGDVLVEKPLFANPAQLPAASFRRLGVAYNLRFHPVIGALRTAVTGTQVFTIEVYCGQYLPDWRPTQDWQTGYSASSARGGGVLRDLSHELDYLAWIFGPWRRLTALGGNLGLLKIDADEAWVILMELASGASVSLQLNYFDRVARRRLVVQSDRGTITADLIAGSLSINGAEQRFSVDTDATVRAEHAALAGGDMGALCSAHEALATLDTIAAIERSARESKWIAR